MAESVDALVSNTSGVKSIPVRSRVWVQEMPDNRMIIGHFDFCRANSEQKMGQRNNPSLSEVLIC